LIRLRSQLGLVAAITAIGAALRFATLDRQSFWLDELVTVSLVRRDFGDMLGQIPETEATPYLYYVLGWGWAWVFGFGEIGLRSLSALVGVAVIPVAYAAGSALVSRRVGLVVAALVAVNPFLVWYSQEARSYSLLALLTGCTVLFFGRALRSDRRALAAWAAVSSLAIATHYFAAFLILVEAIWLLYALRPRRPAVVAFLLPAAALVVHLPLLLDQRGNAEAVVRASLAARAAGIPKNLAVGYSFPAEVLGSLLGAGLLLAGLALLVTRASPRDQLGALVAGSLAAGSIAIPLALALLGADHVVARNAIIAVVPAAVFLGAGYASNRLGIAAAAALCALSVAISLAPALDARYGRTDWRAAAKALASPAVDRAIVVTPFMSRTLWDPYLHGLREPEAETARVQEIVVLGLAAEGGFSAGAVRPPDGPPSAPPNGFRLVEFERRATYTLARYATSRPRAVTIEALAGLRLSMEQPGVLIQTPGDAGFH
jgi:mannosyltransferase